MGFVLLAAVFAALTLCLPFVRAARFGLVVWGPVVVFDLLLLAHLLRPLIDVKGGGGPDAGFVGMEVGFYLAFAVPVCALVVISLIVAGFSFPRQAAWNGWGIGAAIMAVAFSVFGFLGQISPAVIVVVLDSEGAPVANAAVSFSTFEFGSGRSLGERRANDKGEIRARLPPQRWSASVESDEGVISWISVGTTSDSFLEPAASVRTLWWSFRDWEPLQPRFARSMPAGGEHRFELRLRKAEEITSKWMAGELHRSLLELLQESRHMSALYDMCDNLESFDEMALLGQIAQKDATSARLVGSVLNHHADVIDRIERMLQADAHRGWKRDNSHSYDAVCRWLKVDSSGKSLREIAPKIRERLQIHADELLKTAEPLWKTQGPVGFHVRTYARSAAPRLLHAMEGVDEKSIAVFCDAVEATDPEVSGMEPFFISDDPRVAVTAIAAVWGKLSPDQRVTAARRLRILSRENDRNWLQFRIEKMIPSVRKAPGAGASEN